MQTDIDLSKQIKEVLNRNNIQIGSMKFVDSDTKENLFAQRTKAIVLINNKVFERKINPLADDHTLDIFDTQLNPYLKKGQPVLVVLPTDGKKRYVLQTKIVNIFIDRFQLVVLDPRDAKRFSFSSPLGVKIRAVCEATAIRIQTGEVRLSRHIDESLLEVPASGNIQSAPPCQDPLFSIKDILLNDEGSDQADDFAKLEGQHPIDGNIIDISCGGMCVSYQHSAGARFFVHQMLVMECSFANGSKAHPENERINLFILAIVRSMKSNQDHKQLNLQFLAALPKTIQSYWQSES
ncbi:MAG: hypothetical protein A2270_04730 [Elusimicrobia bacterium RIFOXYA12_FULL_51_18]|nr:MAG: hypothetical protein A2270_04730 [Elusimicrobia bacterium RIFOXYA12_FULL_51_18]